MFGRFSTAALLLLTVIVGLFCLDSRAVLRAWQRNQGVLRLTTNLSDSLTSLSLQTAERTLGPAAQNGDKRAQFWLGYLYAFQGKAREAQQVYLDSEDLAYWLVLHGRNLYDSVPYGSIEMYERAMAVDTEYSAAYFFTGQSYQRLQRCEQAIEQYIHAIETNRFDPRLASEDGARHHRAGYASIERTYQRLTECHIALRDWESAKQTVERLLELKPDLADGYYLRGQIDYFRVVYNQTNDHQGVLSSAEDWLGSAVERNPRHFWAHVFLGRVYGQMGRLRDAQAEFEIAVSIDPNDPSGRFELGRAYLTLGQIDEAVRHLEVAQDLYPSHRSGWVSLGDAYAAQGRVHQARQAYRQALQIDSMYEPAKQRLSALEGK